jgi:hypothetical protein
MHAENCGSHLPAPSMRNHLRNFHHPVASLSTRHGTSDKSKRLPDSPLHQFDDRHGRESIHLGFRRIEFAPEVLTQGIFGNPFRAYAPGDLISRITAHDEILHRGAIGGRRLIGGSQQGHGVSPPENQFFSSALSARLQSVLIDGGLQPNRK